VEAGRLHADEPRGRRRPLARDRDPARPTPEIARAASEPFRAYYNAIATARTTLGDYLRATNEHHVFIFGAGTVDAEERAAAAAAEQAEEQAQFDPDTKTSP
jgi:hypothetical protein